MSKVIYLRCDLCQKLVDANSISKPPHHQVWVQYTFDGYVDRGDDVQHPTPALAGDACSDCWRDIKDVMLRIRKSAEDGRRRGVE